MPVTRLFDNHHQYSNKQNHFYLIKFCYRLYHYQSYISSKNFCRKIKGDLADPVGDMSNSALGVAPRCRVVLPLPSEAYGSTKLFCFFTHNPLRLFDFTLFTRVTCSTTMNISKVKIFFAISPSLNPHNVSPMFRDPKVHILLFFAAPALVLRKCSY